MWTHGQHSDSPRYILLDAPGVYWPRRAASLYIVWYKNITLFSSLFIARAVVSVPRSVAPSLFLLFFAGEGKDAWGHVTTIMPAFQLLLVLLLIVLHSLLLSFGLSACLPALATTYPSSFVDHGGLRIRPAIREMPVARTTINYAIDTGRFFFFFFF